MGMSLIWLSDRSKVHIAIRLRVEKGKRVMKMISVLNHYLNRTWRRFLKEARQSTGRETSSEPVCKRKYFDFETTQALKSLGKTQGEKCGYLE